MWLLIKSTLFKSEERVTLLCVVSLCATLLFGYGAYDYYFVTGLASDEEMIAQFYAHKEEFEGIIKKFRATGKDDYSELKNAGVFDLCVPKDGKAISLLRWLPEDYPIERYSPAILKSGEPWEGHYQLTREEGEELGYKYGPIRIETLPREKYWRQTWRGIVIRKDLFHFPEETENVMTYFGSHLYFSRVEYFFKGSVLPSLNYKPLFWERGGYRCVFRKIEEHWYIRMC